MVSTPIEKEFALDEQLDSVFHALSDRTRRDLLRRLTRGPAVITELKEPYEMSFAAVSKHLKVLESANLISRKIDGRFQRCTLTATPMQKADRWLREYTAFWEGTLDSLAEFVEASEGEPDI